MVNVEIEKLGRSHGLTDETLHIVCECGVLACSELIVVPTREYARVREDDALFFVKPGHEQAGVGRVVETTTRFSVVRKESG
jgi:hypothetical protein